MSLTVTHAIDAEAYFQNSTLRERIVEHARPGAC